MADSKFTRNPLIIAIGGKMGSGKSTFANALRDAFGLWFSMTPTVLAFATPLKLAASKIFNFKLELASDVWGKERKLYHTISEPTEEVIRANLPQSLNEAQVKAVLAKFDERYKNRADHSVPPPFTVGETLQFLGEAVRGASPFGWIYPMVDRVKEEFADNNAVIIEDLRHQDELHWLQSMERHEGTRVILIKVVNSSGKKRIMVPQCRDPDHVSETDLDKFCGWDFVVDVEHNMREIALDLLKTECFKGVATLHENPMK